MLQNDGEDAANEYFASCEPNEDLTVRMPEDREGDAGEFPDDIEELARPPVRWLDGDEISLEFEDENGFTEGDLERAHWPSAGNPLFFQRLDSADVVYKIKKKKCKFIGNNLQYLVGDLLGEGSYGKVKEVLDTVKLVRRAVKILKKRQLRRIPNGEQNVEREIKLMKKLCHPNVIKLIDVSYNEEKQKMYIFLEYCVAGLQDLLDLAPEKKLPIWQAHNYFTQLMEGLNYLHSKGVIHKDIKPGNLLLTLDERIKITDFGVAEALDPYDETGVCTTSQGSPVFQPPEVANGDHFLGSKLDVWSSGVTLYNMTTGKYPFEGDTVFLLFENIAKGEFSLPEGLDSQLTSLIKGMLQKDPDLRFTIGDIMHHPWYNRRHVQILEETISVPPERRKNSVIPYLDAYLNGPDDESDEYLGEEYRTANEPELPILYNAYMGRDVRSAEPSKYELLNTNYHTNGEEPSNHGAAASRFHSHQQNSTSASGPVSNSDGAIGRQSFWRRSFNCARKLPICRQS